MSDSGRAERIQFLSGLLSALLQPGRSRITLYRSSVCFSLVIEFHFLCWLFYHQFRKKELAVAMDRADHGGSVSVSGLLDPGHSVPELHRGLEAVADGGGGEHRDPVPGHHRLQPLPGDGGSACNHC